jgi:hypothetical protein
VASPFFVSSWNSSAVAWAAPSFFLSHNMSHSDNVQIVAAAATSQVKLCPYDEEEPAIWFCLIEAQFAAAGIKLQKLSLPMQVLWDILDTVDVCNESDQPFDLLKEVLLGQCGKSKWQPYLELLPTPHGDAGPQVQRPHGETQTASSSQCQPRQDLFLAMFLIRLPPSMQEVVGTGNHKTGVAMVRAANALWDARGGHGPMVMAATTQHSRSPAPACGRNNDRRNSNAHSKSRLTSGSDFFTFQNPGNGICKFHNFYNSKAHKRIFPSSYLENWFGGLINTCHCHSHACPSKCRSHFSNG